MRPQHLPGGPHHVRRHFPTPADMLQPRPFAPEARANTIGTKSTGSKAVPALGGSGLFQKASG
eukprot:7564244-Pyramimonas_sp.AAC.1